MARNLDTSLLRSFVTVVESGGMTAAARQLHLTQAAVSQQVKRLEEQLGSQLIRRDRRALTPTLAGEALLDRARRLLALNDEIWTLMTKPEVEGEVRLGVPHDFVGPLLPPILKRFSRAWPRVQVSLRCTTTPILLHELEHGDVDLTLTTERFSGPNGETLFMDPLVWVSAPGGAAARVRPVPLALSPSHECAFRAPAIEALSAAGLAWRTVCASQDMATLLAMVEAELAVIPLMASSIPGHLRAVPDEAGLPELPPFQLNLYESGQGTSEAAHELANAIRTYVAERYVSVPLSQAS
ncbi:MAG: LysR substrate-binding domain-containing protein [Geminicoccaceae bacterium]